MKILKLKTRLFSLFTLISLVFSQILYVPITYAADSNFFTSILDKIDFGPTFFGNGKIDYEDIVAILVPRALYEDETDFVGLNEEDDYKKYLGEDTIKQRIDRYTEILQDKLPQTKPSIVLVEEDDTVNDIATSLEKLYLEGEKEKEYKATLAGIVIMSNFPTEDKSKSVPLPIVNKNGNSFLSLYPYTDFVEKSYIYNSATDLFEFNNDSKDRSPEIWHGVIMPPEGGSEGLNDLAEFLDKNYLYHKGVSDFSEFDKRIFYHDQFRLSENTNSFIFKNYLNYTDFWENIAFLRYTKDLVKDLKERRGEVFENFDGIDNDGDKKTDEEVEDGLDNDDDGLVDEDIGSTNQLDDDQDGKLNEDGGELDWDDRDKDNNIDEDPYGDLNGDGCPGICKTDDDSDSKDVDDDGLITALEKSYGYDPLNKKSPFPLVKLFINKNDFPPADYIDEEPSQSDPGCFDTSGNFHPEWDDDEDGLCDEDTGELNPKTSCYDNDNDCDGKINEDSGDKDEEEKDELDLLPDIFSKKISEKFFSKYNDIYQKYIGDINDLIDSTGRYDVNYMDADGYKRSDYDNVINLVTKKDEVTLNFLSGVNFKIEDTIDSIAKDNLQESIPLFHKAILTGKLYYKDGNDAKDKNFEVDFVNHSIKDEDSHTYAKPYINGRPMSTISTASQCSLYLGDINEENDDSQAKMIKASKVYNPLTYEPYNKDPNEDGYKGKDFGGCNGAFYEYPEFCFIEAAVAPIFDRGVGKKINQETSIDTGASYQSCFDFKYGPNFWGENGNDGKNYLTYAEGVVKDIDDLLNTEQDDPNYDEDDLRDDMDEIVKDHKDKGEYSASHTPFDRAYLLFDDKKASLKELLIGIGFDPNDNKEVQEKFFAFGARSYNVGANVFSGYTGADISIQRFYAEKSDDGFTDDLSKAKKIPSIVYHKEPTKETIAAQLKNTTAVDLPVDDPRYVSFLNKSDEFTEIVYPNIFDYRSYDDFQDDLEKKQLEIAKIPGGSSFSSALTDLFNEDMQNKIKDSLEWKNMNIDEKYQYIFSTYLSSDPSRQSYDGNKVENGYEIFYLNSEGENNEIKYSANGDKPTIDSEAIEETEVQEEKEEEAENTNSNSNSSYNSPTADLKSIPIFDWFEEIEKWIDELDESVFSSEEQLVCSEESEGVIGLEDIIGKEEVAIEPITYEDTQDIDDDGLPNLAEETKSLFIEADKTLLTADANDSTEILVSARKATSSTSAINTKDSFTNVNLVIQNEADSSGEIINILSEKNLTLINGQASFRISSTSIPGKVKIYLSATNNQNLISNKIEIESKKEYLDLSIYQQQNTENNSSTEDEETIIAYLIKNEKDENVAEISKIDYSVKILNPNYEVSVLALTQNKPSRINIINKNDQSLLSSIVLSFENAKITTNGNNISIAEDSIVIKTEKLTVKNYDNYSDLFDYNGALIASIDDFGGLRINPKYKLELKDDILFDWYILDENNDILAEINFIAKDKENFIIKSLDSNFSKLLTNIENFFEKLISEISDKTFAANSSFDQDSDGLKDLEEKNLSTDIYNKDTDSDSYSDANEINGGYDPLQKDTSLFLDMDILHESFSGVIKLMKRGIINGFEIKNGDKINHVFKPENPITREQLVKLALGIWGVNCTQFSEKIKSQIDTDYLTAPFPDNDITESLFYCVKFGKIESIISGYSGGEYDGYFLPQNNISRAEAIKIIINAAKIDVTNPNDSLPWYYSFVTAAKRYEVYPENRFNELDDYDLQDFEAWFQEEINRNGDFIKWLEADMTRAEFAIMVSKVLDNIFDPEQIDTDGDGLSDASEIYQYGTNSKSTNSDDDSYTDYEEIVLGKNAEDSGDNINDSDNDGLSDEYEEIMKLDSNDKDSDDDGILDGDEVLNNTDPSQIDSDNDDANDGDELINGTDINDESSYPISSEEIYKNFDPNIEIFANNIAEEKVYFNELDPVLSSDIEEIYTKRVKADGVSNIYVRASIIDSNGEIKTSDSSSIIEFSLNSNEHGIIENKKVKVSEGRAQTVFNSSTVSGITEVNAKIIEGQKLSEKTENILVYPGQPSRIEIIPSSKIIPSGGDSVIDTQVILYDSFDNIANDSSQKVTIEISGEGEMTKNLDEDQSLQGVQITTFDGLVNFQIRSKENAGDIKINVKINDISDSFIVSSRDDLKLALTIDKNIFSAGQNESSKILIDIVDNNLEKISGINSNYQITLSDNTLGLIANTKDLKITDGKAENSFTANNIAGSLILSVSATGIEEATKTIDILPSEAYKLVLSSDSNEITKDQSAILSAKIFDKYDNFITTDNSRSVKFYLSEETEDYAKIDKLIGKTINGIAETKLIFGQMSGPIIVSASSENLLSSSINMESKYSLDSAFFEESKPNVLFASMLGLPAGDINERGSLAGTFLFSGKTEASLTLTEETDGFENIISISPSGKINVLNPNYVNLQLSSSDDPNLPIKINLVDPVLQQSLAYVFIRPSDSNFEILNEYTIDSKIEKEQGIYLGIDKNFENSYTVKEGKRKLKESIKVFKDENLLLTLNENGQIILNEKYLNLRINQNQNYFAIDIFDGVNLIGQIHYILDRSNAVEKIEEDQSELNANSEVFIKISENNQNYNLKKAKLGSSSFDSFGYFFQNLQNKLPENQRPGQNYKSYESAERVDGIGFKDENKHILTFASGELLGEAVLPYSSEIGILMGDPIITLKKDEENISETGFDKTLGKQIKLQDKEVKEVISPFDYEADGNNDILVAYSDGEIDLIQNQGSNKLKLRGPILNISTGIKSIDKADFNDDSYTDLIVASNESCYASDTSCSYIYWNNKGVFQREYLKIKIDSKTTNVKVSDLNNDSYIDFVASDEKGNIFAFYNSKKGFAKDEQGYLIAQKLINLGLKVDNAENLATELLVNYANMTQDDPEIEDDNLDYQKININDEEISYKYIDTISGLSSSSKYASDIDEGTLDPSDIVKYQLTIKNSSNAKITNLEILDTVSYLMDYVDDSIVCITCSESGPLITMTDHDSYPFIISDINLNPNTEIKFEYKLKVKDKIEIADPQILITTLNEDEYPDFILSTSDNSSGQVMRLLSTAKNENGYISYVQSLSAPEENVNPSQDLDIDTPIKIPPDNNKDGIPDDYQKDTVPEEVDNYLKNSLQGDDDADGLPNEWDNLPGDPRDIYSGIEDFGNQVDDAREVANEALDKLSGFLDTATSLLSCGGGCLALPLNIAFLVPGMYQAFGVPIMMDPSPIPVLCDAIYPPFMSTAIGCYPSLAYRLYISPTLNGGLATSICLGPYPVGRCFSFGIPIWQLLSLAGADVCGAINGAIEGAISKANNAIASATGKIAVALGGDAGNFQSNPQGRTGSGGIESYKLGDYKVPLAINKNIKVPGFPSVLTDWWARQSDEFATLLDLPDLVFIYPDLKSLGQSGANSFSQKLTGPDEILTALNKLPLLKIVPKDVVIKLPSLSPEEILRLITEAKLWISDLKGDFKRASINWSPDVKATYEREITKLIENVEKNIETLEKYQELPLQIIEFKDQLLYYVYQILCYAEAIVDFTIGYVELNAQRVGTWVAEVRNIIKAVKTWQAFLDIAINYQESCDKCSTQRLTLYKLILSLFVFLPDIPILDLPKWPNIIVDVSHINAGLTVYWPQVRFEAANIYIPSLPRIELPTVPDININEIAASLPTIPLLPPPPDLKLIDLPKLPALSLPNLPNIPPAPEFPSLPNEIKIASTIASKIVKIVCIIRSGFIPTSELKLKTVIEDLTARPLAPVLPIDLSAGIIDIPNIKIDSYEIVRVDGYTNLNFETNAIIDTISGIAEKFNKFEQDIIDKVNEGAQDVKNKAQDGLDEVTDKSQDAIDSAADEIEENINSDLIDIEGSETYKNLEVQAKNEINNFVEVLGNINDKNGDFNKKKENFEKDIYLNATNREISIDELISKYSLESIKNKAISDISNPISENANISPYISLRNNLISYIEKEEKLKQDLILAQNEENFYQVLAKNQNNYLLASNKDEIFNNQNIKGPERTLNSLLIAADDELEDEVENLDDETEDAIEEEENGDSGASDSASTAFSDTINNTSNEAQIVNKGIFIYDSKNEVNDRLINYTAEAEKETRISFTDLDNDDDEDIIYTMGQDLYIKFNQENESEKVYNSKLPKTTSIKSIKPNYSSVNNLRLINNLDQNVDFSFKEDNFDNLYGYIAEIKNSITDFDRKELLSPSRKLFLIGSDTNETNNEKNSSIENINIVKYEALQGDINVEKSSNIDDTSLTFGDKISTGENSEVMLSFADNSKAILRENSSFIIPDLSNESMDYLLSEGGMSLDIASDEIFGNSTKFVTRGSILSINYKNQIIADIAENSDFYLPKVSSPEIILNKFDRSATLQSYFAKRIDGDENIFGSYIIHAIEDSEIEIFELDENGKKITDKSYNYTLYKNSIINIDAPKLGLNIELKDGDSELINKEKINSDQKLYKGMALFLDGSVLSTNDGGANISFNNGPTINLNEKNIVEFDSLEEGLSQINYAINNGNFLMNLKSFDNEGILSTVSNNILLSPQLCSDKTAPSSDIGSSEIDLSIFKETTINASKSFDPNGEIALYAWDIDSLKDDDNDGDTMNDYTVISREASSLKIGPYADLNERNIAVTVFDRNGNKSTSTVKVKIYVPQIILNNSGSSSNIIEGSTNPLSSNIPFVMYRNRNGVIETIDNEELQVNGRYYTDENGAFQITLNDQNEYIVKDENDEIIATVNPDTPQIIINEDQQEQYATEVIPATYNLPTQIAIVDSSGYVVFSLIIVPDINTDVRLVGEDFEFTYESVSNLNGIHVKILSDKYIGNPLGGDDPIYPGGLEIVEENKNRISLIATNGNIYLLKESLGLQIKATEKDNDPLVIEMTDNGEVIAEIYISADKDSELEMIDSNEININETESVDLSKKDSDGDGIPDDSELSYGMNPLDPSDASDDNDNDGLTNLEEYKLGTNPNSNDTDGDKIKDGEDEDPLLSEVSPFADVSTDDPIYSTIKTLYENGVLDGQEENGEINLNPDEYIKRGEFTMIMNGMLCTQPEENSYKGPDVFSDVNENTVDDEIYAHIKEAYTNGYITGYGETFDEQTGLTEYKPDNYINIAEQAKIIVEVLAKFKTNTGQTVISLGEVEETEPWYTAWIEIATDLTSYLNVNQTLDEAYIIDTEQASEPERLLTRKEFIEIADRLFDVYNCYEADSDNDGVTDMEEEKLGTDPNKYDSDPDYDGLTNQQEEELGTDPSKSDSDGGGVNDNDEIENGTNPLDTNDDDKDEDGLANTDEAQYGTDPEDPDTDDGGVTDYQEILNATDPLDPSDDYSQDTQGFTEADDFMNSLDEGVYGITEQCTSCPCPTSVENLADITNSDKIYGAIVSEDGTEIYSLSNEIEVK